MGAHDGNIGQAIADPRSQVSNHDRKRRAGNRSTLSSIQEFDCHDDNGKGAKNH
jgi:hypothetical protein